MTEQQKLNREREIERERERERERREREREMQLHACIRSLMHVARLPLPHTFGIYIIVTFSTIFRLNSD